jgi:phosphoribosylformylglycinamidine (FGAM) synthase-like enzyme
VSVPASARLDKANAPSVQVGEPFEDKRLIDACLTLLDENHVVDIQDSAQPASLLGPS